MPKENILAELSDKLDAIFLNCENAVIKNKLHQLLLLRIMQKYQIKLDEFIFQEIEKDIKDMFANNSELLSSIQDAYIEFRNDIRKL